MLLWVHPLMKLFVLIVSPSVSFLFEITITRHALAKQDTLAVRNDIPLFPIQPNSRVVTPELVNRLRDEEG
jgi:hypothetical protein